MEICDVRLGNKGRLVRVGRTLIARFDSGKEVPVHSCNFLDTLTLVQEGLETSVDDILVTVNSSTDVLLSLGRENTLLINRQDFVVLFSQP